MKLNISFEFTSQEYDIIKLLDAINTVRDMTNRYGDKEWSWLADGFSPDPNAKFEELGPYWIMQELFKRVATRFFDDNEQLAENLHDLMLDCGESPSWCLTNRAEYVLRGMGTHYGIWP